MRVYFQEQHSTPATHSPRRLSAHNVPHPSHPRCRHPSTIPLMHPPSQPMVSCEPGGDPATFTGYVIELFRLLAHDQGWAEGDSMTGDYYLECMKYTALMDDLESPTGSCALAAAGGCVVMQGGNQNCGAAKRRPGAVGAQGLWGQGWIMDGRGGQSDALVAPKELRAVGESLAAGESSATGHQGIDWRGAITWQPHAASEIQEQAAAGRAPPATPRVPSLGPALSSCLPRR
jgi:hypothetical protein